jgi:hypothetical protein
MKEKRNPGAAGTGARQGDHESATNRPSAAPVQAPSIYVLRLRPETGTDGIKALRALLKRAWRTYRLRCLSAVEEEPHR